MTLPAIDGFEMVQLTREVLAMITETPQQFHRGAEAPSLHVMVTGAHVRHVNTDGGFCEVLPTDEDKGTPRDIFPGVETGTIWRTVSQVAGAFMQVLASKARRATSSPCTCRAGRRGS
jgi:hypothetical protein